MRSRIAGIIGAIAPHDDQERREIDEVIGWIESGAEIYRIKAPADPPKHLIAYYLPICLKRRRILLGNHRKATLWLPGGGHLEVEEDPLVCLLREMEEELGESLPVLMPSPLFLSLCKTVEQPVVHTDVALWYLVRGDGETIPDFDEREFLDMRWFSWDRLPGRADKNLGRFMEKVEQWQV